MDKLARYFFHQPVVQTSVWRCWRQLAAAVRTKQARCAEDQRAARQRQWGGQVGGDWWHPISTFSVYHSAISFSKRGSGNSPSPLLLPFGSAIRGLFRQVPLHCEGFWPRSHKSPSLTSNITCIWLSCVVTWCGKVFSVSRQFTLFTVQLFPTNQISSLLTQDACRVLTGSGLFAGSSVSLCTFYICKTCCTDMRGTLQTSVYHVLFPLAFHCRPVSQQGLGWPKFRRILLLLAVCKNMEAMRRVRIKRDSQNTREANDNGRHARLVKGQCEVKKGYTCNLIGVTEVRLFDSTKNSSRNGVT